MIRVEAMDMRCCEDEERLVDLPTFSDRMESIVDINAADQSVFLT
ncbi:hypothetical protein ACOJBO_04335 [Rhizobium beringeri]